jgi:hypothetical protein
VRSCEPGLGFWLERAPGGPRVPQTPFFLSGNQASSEYRDGNAAQLHDSRTITISLILSMLSGCEYWPPWCKTDQSQEGAMIHRTLFLHYRVVSEAVTTLVTIGVALLFSYLILWARL